MINPRWRKVFRDLWGNKARTLLVILSIAVGVAAIGVIDSTYSILSNEIPAAYARVNPASARITTTPFDEGLVAVIRNLDRVADVEGRFTLKVRVNLGADNWRDLQLYVIPDFNNIRLNKIWSQSGAWPPGENELLVERDSISLIQTTVGQTVWIQTPEGKQRELKVIGLVHDINYPGATFTNQASGYINLDTLEGLGYPRYYNELLIRVKGDNLNQREIRSVADTVADKIRKSERKVLGIILPEPGKHWFEPYLTPMTTILTLMGALILFLSGFLVIITISALLSQQVRQIGIMKAIGGRTYQIIAMYLFYVLILGAIALAIAIPASQIGTGFAINFIARIINFDLPSYQVPPAIIQKQAVLCLVIPALAAIIPILGSTRITVREAINDPGLSKANFGNTIFDRLLGKVKGLPRPLLLSLRNTFRRRMRLTLTLITLILGSAIFIAVMSAYAALNVTLEESLKYYNFDIVVFFNRPYRVEQIQEEIKVVPGITSAEAWGIHSGRIVRADGSETDNITLAAPPNPTSLINPTLLAGRWLLPDDEDAIVINTDVQREYPQLKVGSHINLKVEDQTTSWRVVGVVRSVFIGAWAYTNYPYFSRIFGRFGLASALYIATTQHDRDYQFTIAKALEDHFDRVGLRVSSTNKVAELRTIAARQFNVIILFLVIMAILLTVVGGLGLTGTMSLNVLERTREIGVLRAIGAPNGAIMEIVVFEGVIIGLISWFLGVLCSYPLSLWLCDVIGRGFLRSPLYFTFSTQGVFLWLGVMVVLSALASYLPARSAIRLTVRDVLAYE